MKSRDNYPNARPDLSVDAAVVQSAARPGRSPVTLRWMWLIFLVLAVLYAVSPVDFVPDLIPVLGWVDDVVVTISAALLALPRIVKRQ